MKIIIDGREYPSASTATLADLIAMKRDTGFDKNQLREMEQELEAMTPEERDEADISLIFIGLTVWMARRRAGEVLTLEQACDFEIDKLQFIAEAGDVDVFAAKSEAPDPTRAGSGRANTPRPQPADRRPSSKKTSKKASTRA